MMHVHRHHALADPQPFVMRTPRRSNHTDIDALALGTHLTTPSVSDGNFGGSSLPTDN
jgi:hypothetical protein